MPRAIDLQSGNRFVALFVGPKHSGKTCAANSFDKPIHTLDFDGRMNGLLGASWIDRNDISYDYFPPRDMGMVDAFNKKLDSMYIVANGSQANVKTEIVDSITSFTHAMITQGKGLTHKQAENKGKFIGPVAMAGPDDYNFESTTTFNLMSFLKSLLVKNIIVTAHITEKYGRLPGPDGKIDPYSPAMVIGEQIALRDKIKAGIGIYFDHIFRFDRRMVNGSERFFVTFRSDLACTSYPELPNGEFDITGKNFCEFMMGFIKSLGEGK